MDKYLPNDRFVVPFIFDNTFATTINCRPLEWGADIHSFRKHTCFNRLPETGLGDGISRCPVPSIVHRLIILKKTKDFILFFAHFALSLQKKQGYAWTSLLAR